MPISIWTVIQAWSQVGRVYGVLVSWFSLRLTLPYITEPRAHHLLARKWWNPRFIKTVSERRVIITDHSVAHKSCAAGHVRGACWENWISIVNDPRSNLDQIFAHSPAVSSVYQLNESKYAQVTIPLALGGAISPTPHPPPST